MRESPIWARFAAWLVAARLAEACSIAAAATAQQQPTSRPAPAEAALQSPPGNPSGPVSDGDLRRRLQEFSERLESLDARHAEEREQDRRRIAELEARVAQFERPEDEAQRQEVMRQQIADMRRSMAGQSTSQPAQSGGAAEDELAGLLGQSGAALPVTPDAQQPGIAGSLQRAIQSFNPDISLNADFLARHQRPEGRDPEEKLQFRELEIGFTGAVDPYAKATVIATVGREDHDWKADLEEGYLYFPSLPFDLQARVGQMRAEFGRVNPVHVHAIPWPDYPFVIRRFFGEEGLSGAGGEVSWLIPNPWKQYIALTYEILGNDNDAIFAGAKARDVTNLVRLRTFRDLTPTTTLEFGGSFATAPNDEHHGSKRSMVEGVDFTLRWKPKEAGLYKSFLWQNEVLFAQADIIGGQESSWGMYSAGEYQFARQWKLGARYDDTNLPAESSVREQGYSGYLTFLQSEFVFWRLAYIYADRDFRDNGVKASHQVMLQLDWTLGAHPAHRY